MYKKKKNPLIKKQLRKFSWQNISFLRLNKSIQAIIGGFFVAVFLCIIGLSLMKYNNEQASIAIQDSLAHYFLAINDRDYDAVANKYLSTSKEETDAYIKLLEQKTKAIQLQSIKPDIIFPAFINGNLGITGAKVTTKGIIENKNITATEISIFIMKKENNEWKIAHPSDLKNYSEDYLINMLDKYKEVLAEYPEVYSVVDINSQQFNNFKQEIKNSKAGNK